MAAAMINAAVKRPTNERFGESAGSYIVVGASEGQRPRARVTAVGFDEA